MFERDAIEAGLAEAAVKLRSPLEALRLANVPDVARLEDAGALSRFVVRGDDAAVAGLAAWLGVLPPKHINRAQTIGDDLATHRSVLKLGPDEWLVLAGSASDLQPHGPETSRLVLVDISHRNAGLLISGPRVEAVLAAGCPLPLESAAFPIGRATRTLYAKAEIVLWRRAETTFHVEVARSFAPYLVAHLGEAIDIEAALAAHWDR